jgi:hypothetical protein
LYRGRRSRTPFIETVDIKCLTLEALGGRDKKRPRGHEPRTLGGGRLPEQMTFARARVSQEHHVLASGEIRKRLRLFGAAFPGSYVYVLNLADHIQC